MRQRQTNLCELEASMVCILSSRLSKAGETLSQKQNKQTTQLALSGLEQYGVYVYGFIVLVSVWHFHTYLFRLTFTSPPLPSAVSPISSQTLPPSVSFFCHITCALVSFPPTKFSCVLSAPLSLRPCSKARLIEGYFSRRKHSEDEWKPSPKHVLDKATIH